MASTSSLSECRDTPELPGGSLNLMFLCVSHLYFSGPEARFERLPKLVRATIAIGHVLLEGSIDMNARGDEGADWPFPRSIPSCISLNLKTCEEEETKKQRKVVLGVAVTLFYCDTQ
ncbi:hypothetical protein JHK87_055791 [Glycine soja]|nr:hypothetical protein JHK87_055791 [Glycine soja]